MFHWSVCLAPKSPGYDLMRILEGGGVCGGGSCPRVGGCWSSPRETELPTTCVCVCVWCFYAARQQTRRLTEIHREAHLGEVNVSRCAELQKNQLIIIIIIIPLPSEEEEARRRREPCQGGSHCLVTVQRTWGGWTATWTFMVDVLRGSVHAADCHSDSVSMFESNLLDFLHCKYLKESKVVPSQSQERRRLFFDLLSAVKFLDISGIYHSLIGLLIGKIQIMYSSWNVSIEVQRGTHYDFIKIYNTGIGIRVAF